MVIVKMRLLSPFQMTKLSTNCLLTLSHLFSLLKHSWRVWSSTQLTLRKRQPLVLSRQLKDSSQCTEVLFTVLQSHSKLMLLSLWNLKSARILMFFHSIQGKSQKKEELLRWVKNTLQKLFFQIWEKKKFTKDV